MCFDFNKPSGALSVSDAKNTADNFFYDALDMDVFSIVLLAKGEGTCTRKTDPQTQGQSNSFSSVWHVHFSVPLTGWAQGISCPAKGSTCFGGQKLVAPSAFSLVGWGCWSKGQTPQHYMQAPISAGVEDSLFAGYVAGGERMMGYPSMVLDLRQRLGKFALRNLIGGGEIVGQFLRDFTGGSPFSPALEADDEPDALL